MRDSLTGSTAADFRQRYENTYGYYLGEEDKKILVHVTKVTQREMAFKSLSGEFVCFANKDVQFEFLPVQRGFVDSSLGLFYFSRHPARQWQRGMSDGNTKLYKSSNGWATASLTLETLTELLHYPLACADSVAAYFEKKQQHAALSKHFAIIKGLVYFYEVSVGEIDKKHQITLNNTLVLQELSDLLRKNYSHTLLSIV